MRRSHLFTPFILLLILFFGCKPKPADPGQTSPTSPTTATSSLSASQLIGSWTLSDTISGTESWVFNPDGTYKSILDGDPETGKWRLSGDRLILNDEEEIAARVSLVDGQLLWAGDVYDKVGTGTIAAIDLDVEEETTPTDFEKEPPKAKEPAPKAKAKPLPNKRVCRIKVGTFKEAPNSIQMAKINDLGVLLAESTENGYTRVYLGSFLNRNTAEKVLAKVKQRGFKEAYIAVDTDLSNDVYKKDAKYFTFQIAAAKELNLVPFVNFDGGHKDNIFILYDNGMYKVSLGLYTKDLYHPQIEEEYNSYAASFGFNDGFTREVN